MQPFLPPAELRARIWSAAAPLRKGGNPGRMAAVVPAYRAVTGTYEQPLATPGDGRGCHTLRTPAGTPVLVCCYLHIVTQLCDKYKTYAWDIIPLKRKREGTLV